MNNQNASGVGGGAGGGGGGDQNRSLSSTPSSLTGGGGGSTGVGGNANNKSGGSLRQCCGTVPKTKPSRKHSVPQEIVAPTRRDLQQHLNDLVHWASSTSTRPTSTVSVNQASSIAAGEASLTARHRHRSARGNGSLLDLDNLSLQEHATNNRFIPVRPIVRGNADDHQQRQQLHITTNGDQLSTSSTSTAIGVVIPTTPVSQQDAVSQRIDPNETLLQKILNPRSRTAAAASQPSLDSSSSVFRLIQPSRRQQQYSDHHSNHREQRQQAATSKHLDDRILEIKDYIRTTSSLIHSIHQDSQGEVAQSQHRTMVNEKLFQQPINSIHLETLANSGSESEMNGGPRPQSVASIHSNGTTPDTPTFDDLQHRLQSSNRNMDMIREQQNQMLCLQKAARSHLADLERAKAQNPTMNLAGEEPPNYEEVEQVQEDASGLMNRMHALTKFIHDQNELASMLGGQDIVTEDILREQAVLEKKLHDLKVRKGQMDALVGELQSMNEEASQGYAENPQTPQSDIEHIPVNRTVPVTLERIVPIEILPTNGDDAAAGGGMRPVQNTNSGSSLASQATLMNCVDLESELEHMESELFESESVDGQQSANNDVIGNKIAEINAMKDQLKRLQSMMETVKLIENKVNGPEPGELAHATREVDMLASQLSMEKQVEKTPLNEVDLEPVLSGRVQALHSMTQDLRAQAVSLASERDRLRTIKDEMIRRNAEERAVSQATKEANDNAVRDANAVEALNYQRASSQQRQLKEEYERKKKEFEQIVQKMSNIQEEQQKQRAVQNNNLDNESDRERPAPKLRNDQVIYDDSFATGINPSAPWRRASHSGAASSHQQEHNVLPTQQEMSASIAQLQNHHHTQLFNQQQQQQQPQQSTIANSFTSEHPQQQQQQRLYTSSASTVGSIGLANQSPMHAGHGDSLLLQQFIQTQQMLINSISQCNQLLWAQQRELNNLNNAVLMLQERFIKQESTNGNPVRAAVDAARAHRFIDQASNRAESVPHFQSMAMLRSHSNIISGDPSPNIQSSNVGNQSGPVGVPTPSYLRAQSEQPSAASSYYHHHGTSTANFGNAPPQQQQQQQQPPLSPVRIFPMYNNQSLLRTGRTLSGGGGGGGGLSATNNNLIHLNNNLANNNTNNLTNNLNQMNNLSGTTNYHSNNLNNITNDLSNNRMSRVTTANVQNMGLHHLLHHQQQQQQQNNDHQLFVNNLNSSNLSHINNHLDQLPPIHPQQQQQQQHHHHHQQHLFNAQQQQTTLNNQVAPGNRANNYWDNFRSYSRQNLLSGNSCKSNEDSCASSTSNYQPTYGQQQQQQQQNSDRSGSFPYAPSQQAPQTQLLGQQHPNLYNHHLLESKVQCRSNMMMDLRQTATTSDFQASASNMAAANNSNYQNNNLNNFVNNLQQHPNQQQQQQQQDSSAASPSLANANMMTLATDILGFHTNPINLGVADFAVKSKTMSKGTKKRTRSHNDAAAVFHNNNNSNNTLCFSEAMAGITARQRNANVEDDDDDEEEEEDSFDCGNPNLATSAAVSNAAAFKSTSKFFESLRENVSMEVSALIQSNDLRPYFLIQLFRDLQLMSATDPQRYHTLQSIQNLYNRYVESTIQEEVSMQGGAATSSFDVRRPADDQSQLLHDGEEGGARRMLVNDLKMATKTENDDVMTRDGGGGSDDEEEKEQQTVLTNGQQQIRSKGYSDNVRRQQHIRRLRTRLDEMAVANNHVERPDSLNPFSSQASSAASSESTPIRSALNENMPMLGNGEFDSQNRRPAGVQFLSLAEPSSTSSPLSTDQDYIRLIMREIAEYLQSIEPVQGNGQDTVSEPMIRRVAKIIDVHLNNSINERLLMTNFRGIDRDELLVNLREFSQKSNNFLKQIEFYLRVHFFDAKRSKPRFASMDNGAAHPDDDNDGAEGFSMDGTSSERLAKKQNNTIVKQTTAATDPSPICPIEAPIVMDSEADSMHVEEDPNEEGQQEEEPVWVSEEDVDLLSPNDEGSR